MKITYTCPGGDVYNLHTDILEQTHVLIAGTTGAGKSVLLNGCIYSALASRFPFDQPDGMQLILIDPKRIELSMFRNLPHTIAYANTVPGAVEALQKAVDIMEQRQRISEQRGEDIYTGSDIYVLIDELADLMTTAKRQVLPLLQRLGQVGRASRLHMIACTQCPLASVISTPLKCIFTAVVGLRTKRAQDSRNIIGVAGCENLPQYGIAFYDTPAVSVIRKVKIPFVSRDEIKTRAAFWTAQGAGRKVKRHFFRRAG